MPVTSRRIAGLVVLLAVLAAVGAIVWVFVLVWNEESPIEPVPSPVASPMVSPVTTPEQTVAATPMPTRSVVPTVVPGSLPDLLRYAPDRLANNSLPLSDIARYADIAGWMTARDISVPSDALPVTGDTWERELDALAMPEVVHARGNDPSWRSTYGFSLVDVDQLLAVGQAPDFVMIMRGDFDPDVLHAAWVQSGYQAVRTNGYTIWSLFPGDAVDLSAPASRPALGNMNNVVLLDDGTLIATSRLSRMEETLRVVRGEASSLGQNPAIASLMAPGAGAEQLVSAMIVRGTVLASAPSTPVPTVPAGTVGVDATFATPEMLVPMPVADLVLAGIAAPVQAEAIPVMSLIVSYDSVDDATRAMARVDHALRADVSPVTGDPYTDRMQPLGTRVVNADEGAVLLVEARPLAGADDWQAILDERDLGFLAWPWNEGQ
ncbi:MAG TPA: hypothetical protein VNZ55_04635 [Thermomicrobiales bacterium]|nr:hypothetical protein [Thermomicrobiales bacterium]